jgi:hypothetical protein
MRSKILHLACILACLLVGISALGQGNADPLTGRWSGDWGPTPTHRNPVTVEMKWDGKNLTGNVNPGPTAIPLSKTSFDAKTGGVHMEADADVRGRKVHYVITGKVDKDTMTGSWNHDQVKGDFKITKSK